MAENLTCLLVDDDLDDHEIFNMALTDLGEDVIFTTAVNAPDALQQLSSQNNFIPDYIFLDLNMPRMDGKQCLAAIKSQPHLHHIPVIIYSTSSSPGDINEFMSMGATAYIKKPSSIPELTKTLHNIFISQPANSSLSA